MSPTNLFLYIFLSTLPTISSYKICIVGASSGLGKELVYQSTNKSDIEIIALSNSLKEFEIPCRVDPFRKRKVPFKIRPSHGTSIVYTSMPLFKIPFI